MSSNIFNENNFLSDNELIDLSKRLIIRIQNRGGKKKITIVNGLECITSEQVTLLRNTITKNNGCSGSLKKDEINGEYLLFSGDQIESIINFVIKNKYLEKDNIVIMGA